MPSTDFAKRLGIVYEAPGFSLSVLGVLEAVFNFVHRYLFEKSLLVWILSLFVKEREDETLGFIPFGTSHAHPPDRRDED